METKNWSKLYKSSAIITWVTLVLIPVQITIFILWPPPTEALGFYEVFKKNALIGLFNLDLLYLLTVLLMGYIYLALFAGLNQSHLSESTIALFLGLIGVAVYFVSNISFEMLILSNKYGVAEGIENKKAILSMGELLLLRYKGTAFGVYYILNGLSLIIFSFAMLKSKNFTKRIAVWGLVSGFLMLVPSTIGIVGMIFALTSLIPTSVWLVLIAQRFNKLSISKSKEY